MADSKTVFAYIGIGCVVLIGLMAIAMGACGVWVYSEAQRFEEEMRDPEARGDRVMSVLGTDELPEGYYPMMSFSVPFVMEVAMLTDRENIDMERDPDFGDRGFIYTKMLRFGQDEQELRDFFEGRSDDAHVLADNGIHLDIDEVIERGTMQVGDAELLYVTQRGDVNVGRGGRSGDGALTSMALVECAGDERFRIGIWFVPDPEAPAEGVEADLAGTPADTDAVADFYSHFDLCS